jgi:hypothetical protein
MNGQTFALLREELRAERAIKADLLACLKEAVASWELAPTSAYARQMSAALAPWKAAIAKAEGRLR